MTRLVYALGTATVALAASTAWLAHEVKQQRALNLHASTIGQLPNAVANSSSDRSRAV
jgi:hypothetical protein